MQLWISTARGSPFRKERIGLVLLIAFFCALVLIYRVQSLIDFTYLATAIAEFAEHEKSESGPHDDGRMLCLEHQASLDDDDGHSPDRYLIPSCCYPLPRHLVKRPAASAPPATDWISEPTVPPPRRL
ncbi:hypothetical protein sS8_4592 [Methylocaldum marinum]|uniref:Uncharacterized protein n=1 Tax=Methylocaldum marinum TaxID=1432792 RepID=A0A250KY54_9GAMM|nr:hypothetical protein sS8_4592 [Methylocaldum marinum]